MIGLSQKAQNVAAFIRAYQSEHGQSPTYGEIADGVGIKSKHSIYNIVRELSQAGVVRLRRFSSGKVIKRGLELVEHPICRSCGQSISPGLKPGETLGGFSTPSAPATEGLHSQRQVR